jgi:hypothetical protein
MGCAKQFPFGYAKDMIRYTQGFYSGAHEGFYSGTTTQELLPFLFVRIHLTKNTTEISADLLPRVVEEFENFLRGCGYHFDGHLDFVDDE